MAVVTVSGTDAPITAAAAVAEFLAGYGIWYRCFEHLDRLAESASDEEILAAFDAPIQERHSVTSGKAAM